jgi:hypothetical protein
MPIRTATAPRLSAPPPSGAGGNPSGSRIRTPREPSFFGRFLATAERVPKSPRDPPTDRWREALGESGRREAKWQDRGPPAFPRRVGRPHPTRTNVARTYEEGSLPCHHEHLFGYPRSRDRAPLPELVENHLRSAAMLTPGATALNREEALEVLEQLVEALRRLGAIEGGAQPMV